MKKIITNSEKETQKFAREYARDLKGGEVIGLIGNLGAGKTTFTQALAKALGVKRTVTSPTFVLMKVYKAKQGEIKNICHIDAYRVNTEKDLEAIGALEYFSRSDTVTIVEWADKTKNILPKKIRFVKIKQEGENKRLIKF